MSTDMIETDGTSLPCLEPLLARWERADAPWHERQAVMAIRRGWFRIITDRTGRDLYLLRIWLGQPNTGANGKWESAGCDLLHFIARPDSDPCLHDHPWDFETEILAGGYVEHVPPSTWPGRLRGEGPAWDVVQHHRKPGDKVERKAEDLHCIGRLLDPAGCWTRVRTSRELRAWGFHPPGQPWLPFQAYLDTRAKQQTERVENFGARTLATALLLIVCMVGLPAQEVPNWVLRGIAAVETGSTWRDIGEVTYRDRRVGPIGEVGPWQLSPDVLADLGVSAKAHRVHRDVVLAESLTRAWLVRCYARTGDWFDAVAIYHTGPQGSKRRGRDYADRVRNVGML